MQSTTTEANAVEILLAGSLDPEQIRGLRRELYSNIAVRKELDKAVGNLERKVSRGSDGQARLRLGVGHWLLGQYREGATALSKETARANGALYYALCLLEQKRPGDALMALEHAVSKKPDSFELRILLVRAHREVGNTNTAEEMLMDLEEGYQDRADYHYEKGCCLEAQGLYEESMDEYDKAVTLDPEHARAIFRLAQAYDLRGNDDKAIEYYELCRKLNPTYTNALINLGLLYEDNIEYKSALKCYREVLEAEPTHVRAQLYLKDVLASLDMYYDEDKAKQHDKRLQVLHTPVTDFELSVRSRNCLSKMRIRALGDLVKKTEQELLAFKNFGETSLREIRNMLKQKGLRLGMALEIETDFPALAPGEAEVQAADDTALTKPISQLELTSRAGRVVEGLNLETIGDLVAKTEQELMACKNFGQASLDEIKNRLDAMGLKLSGK